ncbi:MAG: type II toxin-antitoxin system RelE/ParE family toxin [Bacteroidota bacterium]|nr:type II toxin-antitoxin system RelE/ParE family toxin [Bacteroidota bacterium]
MGKRKITILETVVLAVAEVSWFIESKGLSSTAKKFVDEVFTIFESLADDKIVHHPCRYKKWKEAGYRCVRFKKYTIAYLESEKEIIICEFVASKLLQ